MLIEQLQRYRLIKRRCRRRDLGQHIDAVGVFVDQALESVHLALDPAKTFEHRVLVARIARRHDIDSGAVIHTPCVPPGGIEIKPLPRVWA